MNKLDKWKTTVTIPQEEYDELLDREWKLTCLENAGVDNWDGYDWAMEECNKDED